VPNAEEFVIPHGVRSIHIVRMLRPDIDAEEGQRAIEDMEVEDVADLKVLPRVKAPVCPFQPPPSHSLQEGDPVRFIFALGCVGPPKI
jgi:sugar-phosphatase